MCSNDDSKAFIKKYTYIISSVFLLFILIILLCTQQISIELFSSLAVIVLGIGGLLHQSEENRKAQDLQNKREAYANLMEALYIFKRTGDKGEKEKTKAGIIYFRSSMEASDKVSDKLLKYFEAYIEWTKEKSSIREKTENDKFDNLVQEMKKEINPKSEEKFKYYTLK